jgi:hypothetical protein
MPQISEPLASTQYILVCSEKSLGGAVWGTCRVTALTPGNHNHASRLGSSSGTGSSDELRSLADGFMRRALDGPDPWAALEHFANNIRAGLTTEESILEVVSQHGDVFV